MFQFAINKGLTTIIGLDNYDNIVIENKIPSVIVVGKNNIGFKLF